MVSWQSQSLCLPDHTTAAIPRVQEQGHAQVPPAGPRGKRISSPGFPGRRTGGLLPQRPHSDSGPARLCSCCPGCVGPCPCAPCVCMKGLGIMVFICSKVTYLFHGGLLATAGTQSRSAGGRERPSPTPEKQLGHGHHQALQPPGPRVWLWFSGCFMLMTRR